MWSSNRVEDDGSALWNACGSVHEERCGEMGLESGQENIGTHVSMRSLGMSSPGHISYAMVVGAGQASCLLFSSLNDSEQLVTRQRNAFLLGSCSNWPVYNPTTPTISDQYLKCYGHLQEAVLCSSCRM